MQNGDKGLPSIILIGQGLLMKMLITLEPHGKLNRMVNFNQILHTNTF